MNDEMKDEYDFTRGVRGKFYRLGAKLHLPVYLDERLQQSLSETAERKGISLNALVNDLLNKEAPPPCNTPS